MGRLPKFSILQPQNISELSAFLAKYKEKSIILAGGTQIIPNLKKRLYPFAEVVISIANLDELKFIRYDSKRDILEIGALTTIFDIINSPVIKKKIPTMIDCAKLIAAPPIATKATIGGNIALDTRCLYFNQSYEWRKVRDVCYKAGGNVCNAVKGSKRCFAVFSADLPPFLMAVGAMVEIVNAEEDKCVKLSEFYTGKGKKPNILNPDDVITKVIIENVSEKKCIYEKFRLREAIDYPLAGVAVGFDSGNTGKVDIVLNAVESKPVLIKDVKVNKNNIDDIANDIIKKAHPVPNLTSVPEYRKDVCGRLFKKIMLNFKL